MNLAAPTERPEPHGMPAALGPSANSDGERGVASPGVAEESTMHPIIDEESGDEHPYWSGMEIPETYRREINGNTTPQVRRAVRKVHRGVGHPSKEVFLNMLRLANASGAVIAYAKVWVCPVCAAAQMPSIQLPRLYVPSGSA